MLHLLTNITQSPPLHNTTSRHKPLAKANDERKLASFSKKDKKISETSVTARARLKFHLVRAPAQRTNGAPRSPL
ncbi:hypothetical protein EVAR_728_1 [Eumeta japonica]|uniref:Uncharacterized protein n=1 Tax=Eumeta variegata TaxID=151549 RepID=A0A4C1SBV8_EUMVA|nr:hypothetical protein EVAR_728_1 [Eumeta japonica]